MKETATILDLIGRTCIRRADKQKFIFSLPKDPPECSELVLFNLSNFNKQKIKGFGDKPMMLPTIIKADNFADNFEIDWKAEKAHLQIGEIDTRSQQWQDLLDRDKNKSQKRY